MNKIPVVCPKCNLKFSIPASLSHYDQIFCVSTGGHYLGFKVDTIGADQKTPYTNETIIKYIEERQRNQ
jgi:hypothetical protein